jgi:hypothetical protein
MKKLKFVLVIKRNQRGTRILIYPQHLHIAVTAVAAVHTGHRPVQLIAAGLRQHSRSLFRGPVGIHDQIFVHSQSTYLSGSGSSSTRGLLGCPILGPRKETGMLHLNVCVCDSGESD